jgi:hypothetical protein
MQRGNLVRLSCLSDIDVAYLPWHHIDPRIGLMIWTPAKAFSLSVTTMQSFALVTAAMIISSPLRGLPACFPSAINPAQTKAAFSSSGKMRPANKA